MTGTLWDYGYSEYSENGEDGIIDEILNRLDINGGWYCEFGAWDGKHYSNTYRLIDDYGDWKGVLIEGDKAKYSDLEKTVQEHPDKITPLNSFITPRGDDCLDNLLDKTSIPKQFDILSIDVDSEDYWIWKYLTDYHPTIVIILTDKSS